MISDEAVLAGVQAFHRVLFDKNNGSLDPFAATRAALEAALPHLLEVKRDAIRDIVESAMNSTIPEPWEVSNHATNCIISAVCGSVHSPDETEGSRDEPRTKYVAVTEAVRLAEKQMTSLREALARRSSKGIKNDH